MALTNTDYSRGREDTIDEFEREVSKLFEEPSLDMDAVEERIGEIIHAMRNRR